MPSWVFLTLDEGCLLTAAPPDLERGVAPLGPPAPAQPPLLGRGVAPRREAFPPGSTDTIFSGFSRWCHQQGIPMDSASPRTVWPPASARSSQLLSSCSLPGLVGSCCTRGSCSWLEMLGAGGVCGETVELLLPPPLPLPHLPGPRVPLLGLRPWGGPVTAELHMCVPASALLLF